jgi:hypothetical protein
MPNSRLLVLHLEGLEASIDPVSDMPELALAAGAWQAG